MSSSLSANSRRQVVIIGGGHNALVCAAYLSRAKVDCLVLERRHLLGGAAVTEEVIPGFKFSRCSYLAGLLRPSIIKELQLAKYGKQWPWYMCSVYSVVASGCLVFCTWLPACAPTACQTVARSRHFCRCCYLESLPIASTAYCDV
jgi:phytoene dehydrogenase-like protein